MERSHGRTRDAGRAVPNALDVARDAFAWLVTGPDPVSIDGRLFPGLPNRRIPLDELRDRLLARGCSQATRDAVWVHLVLRSRVHGSTWTLGAVGVALPALASVAATLSARFAGDPADVQAEVLRGFLAELATIDLRRPRIMLRLRWAAYRSGYAAVAEALRAPTPIAPGFGPAVPPPPFGHPDLVLARAVGDGVLTRAEADLIGTTRLERLPVPCWADDHGMTAWAAYKMRRRAEQRLVAYLLQADDGPPSTRPPRRPATEAEPSRRARAARSGGRGRKRPRKPPTRVSKTSAGSGVQGCGDVPPSTASTEVPRCA